MATNKLEKAFDLGFKKFLKDYYFLFNQPDIPPLFASKLRFKPKQTVDRILLSRTRNIALELKKSKQKLISFSRFQDHQIEELEEFKQKAGESYFLVSLHQFTMIVLIDIDQFKILRQNINKKSFNVDDVQTIDHQIIDAKKLRTNYRLDLRFLKSDSTCSSFYK